MRLASLFLYSTSARTLLSKSYYIRMVQDSCHQHICIKRNDKRVKKPKDYKEELPPLFRDDLQQLSLKQMESSHLQFKIKLCGCSIYTGVLTGAEIKREEIDREKNDELIRQAFGSTTE